MIKTLSPYYIYSNFLQDNNIILSFYDLELYIWSGLKTNRPVEPTFTIRRDNSALQPIEDKVNISRYISHFIKNNVIKRGSTGVYSSEKSIWVEYNKIFNLSDNEQYQVSETLLATKGYTYGNEGENIGFSDADFLSNKIVQRVNKTGVYICSLLASETENKTVKLIDGNNIEYDFILQSTINSNDLIKEFYINLSDFDTDILDIEVNGVYKKTLILEEEKRFNPLDFAFINKEGTIETITFFKRKTDTLKVKKEVYESSFGQPINGVHQYNNFNINGRDSFNINSGFVLEENNEIYTQLLLSSKVWVYENDNFLPVNISTEEIEYKSREKDKLINYNIKVDYSFNKINNI